MTGSYLYHPTQFVPRANRRQFPRFQVQPMYTPVAVRFLDEEHFRIEGHAYDISEGGIQFELDRAIAPGTAIALRVALPRGAAPDSGPGRAVFVLGNVVWFDDSEPGPVRMAMTITRYCRAGDRERLLRQLQVGRFRQAA